MAQKRYFYVLSFSTDHALSQDELTDLEEDLEETLFKYAKETGPNYLLTSQGISLDAE